MTTANLIWHPAARQLPSPNFNERPAEVPIDLIIVHGISLPVGVFGGSSVEQLFTNCLDCDAHPDFDSLRGLEVSSHLLIRRCGELVQFVPFDKRAWHAGQSCFDGRENCNDFSIGIELEGADDIPYTELQYRRLLGVCKDLMRAFPQISAQRIVGHCDIAPGRKNDPGDAFDWDYFHQQLGR